jgi:hypothetical protein
LSVDVSGKKTIGEGGAKRHATCYGGPAQLFGRMTAINQLQPNIGV